VFEKLIQSTGGWSMSLCDAFAQQGGPMGLLPLNPRESLLPLELEEALETRGAVMMEYMDASQKRTQRIVKPLEVRKFNGELILVAHCQLRDDRRNFKLDRIVSLTRCDGVASAAVQSEPSMQDTPAPEPR
jgi:predicted DNA-binding transcriptional regulator YafY